MQGDREKCIAAGMDDYLAKPIRPADVRGMIERWARKIWLPPAGRRIRARPAAAVAPPAAEPPVEMTG
jgi:DNA-binding response OmpR family regulator